MKKRILNGPPFLLPPVRKPRLKIMDECPYCFQKAEKKIQNINVHICELLNDETWELYYRDEHKFFIGGETFVPVTNEEWSKLSGFDMDKCLRGKEK